MKMYEKNGVRVELDTIHADAFKQAGWKEVVAPRETPESTSETVTEESATSEKTDSDSVSDLRLEEMTKEELLEYASKIGVNASTRASKADIVNAIRNKK